MPTYDRTDHKWGFRKNQTTGASRVHRHIEGLIGLDGKRLQVIGDVELRPCGKLDYYHADTTHGQRWARFENGHIKVWKEMPGC